MSFLEQVTLALMEDIRMKDDGNCNMFTIKKGSREISVAGASCLQYAFTPSDVNSVLRSSMLTAESTTFIESADGNQVDFPSLTGMGIKS